MIPSVFRYVALLQLPSRPNQYVSGYGYNSRPQITTEDGVTFNFKDSSKSTGEWNVGNGQLHEILYIK